jgi:hypothetical protein
MRVGNAGESAKIVKKASHESPELSEAWNEVLANWRDDDAHRRFIALCEASGRLDFAGGCYRSVRDGDPEREAEARRRVSAVLAYTAKELERLKTPRTSGPSLLYGVLFLTSLSMFLYSLWLLSRVVR